QGRRALLDVTLHDVGDVTVVVFGLPRPLLAAREVHVGAHLLEDAIPVLLGGSDAAQPVLHQRGARWIHFGHFALKHLFVSGLRHVRVHRLFHHSVHRYLLSRWSSSFRRWRSANFTHARVPVR